LPKSYSDFETKKSLHVTLTRETHSALRVMLFKQHLSMQEVFEELAIRIISEEPYMLDTLLAIADNKRKKATTQLPATDAESIFKVIEDENPFSVDGN
jgi:hypothetical protein